MTFEARVLDKLKIKTDSLVHRMALEGNEQDLLSYFSKINDNANLISLREGPFGVTIAHICAIRGWRDALAWMILRSVAMQEIDCSGSSPLHLAKNANIFQQLLGYKLDPYLLDKQGRPAAMMPYILGWANFDQKNKVNDRTYYPFPIWTRNARLETWYTELLQGNNNELISEETESLTKVELFIEKSVRANLGAYIKDRIAENPLPYQIVAEPQLNNQWTCHAQVEIMPGQIVALYSGKFGLVGVDRPKDSAYTFIQNKFFVDATEIGSGAECINDSFPNLTSITLDENGVTYTVLVATEVIFPGQGLFYYYGEHHPLKVHVELNQALRDTWLSTHRKDVKLMGPWEKINELTKRQYLKKRYID